MAVTACDLAKFYSFDTIFKITATQAFRLICKHIYTTINFTDEFRNVAETRQGVCDGSGRLICGWLGVVVAWKADLNSKR